ncbi:hypothetical protein NOVO_03150 [Rickettsiales bacterium Ac37b]|nr:hypothetical protein NOVO_03150 [Rickettsiales bacterium Ac37b]
MRKFFILIILLCTACEHKLPAHREIKFQDNNFVMFKAKELEIIFNHNKNLIQDNIGDKSYVTLKKAVEKWVHARIKVSGEDIRILKIVVKDAKIIKTEMLDQESGLKSLLTKPMEVYKAELEVALEFYLPESLFPNNVMTISANCTKSLQKGASLDERDQLFYDIAQQLIAAIDVEFNKNVNVYLGELVTYF